jgi:integrase
MRRWSQDRDVPKLRYQPELDPKDKGWHYLWEGAGFGVQVFRTGRRHWIQTGSIKDAGSGKFRSYFRKLGNVSELKLAEARVEGNRVKVECRDAASIRSGGFEARTIPSPTPGAVPIIQIAPVRSHEDVSHDVALANTSLGAALVFYEENRNCAPASKKALASIVRTHLADWLCRPLLTIDSLMLQPRYKEVIADVKAQGKARAKRYAKLSAAERLTKAADGYFSGIKTANDVIEGFGRIYRYWTTIHLVRLQRAGILVPTCPTDALIDDLEPEAQRVKSIPIEDLQKLFASFPTYEDNALHPLLVQFLLATGLRVGIAMGINKEYIQTDRIVIPAHAARSKVRWKKRHLEHMAFIIPITPMMRAIIERIALVAPRYGDADTWLFPSRTSFSGHMEEERDATHRLRRHALIRFTMHQLRHNVGTAAEKVGYRRSDVAEILHQAKSNVTDRYIDERIERHREMLIRINDYFSSLLSPALSSTIDTSEGGAVEAFSSKQEQSIVGTLQPNGA